MVDLALHIPEVFLQRLLHHFERAPDNDGFRRQFTFSAFAHFVFKHMAGVKILNDRNQYEQQACHHNDDSSPVLIQIVTDFFQ